MKRALVIGGRGQCGMAISERLLADGWDVTATTSGPIPDASDPAGTEWAGIRRARFDRSGADDLGAVVGGDTDLVVDATAFTVGHAEQVLSLGDRIGAVIALSTLSVYTDADGRSLEGADDEASFPAWPVPIPEDWPTLAPGDGSYSPRKAAVEAVLRQQTAVPVTIVRPGTIYGPYSHHLREWYFIKRVLDGRRRVVLPFGGRSIFQPTAAANLAELVRLAAARPGHRTLNCGDPEPPTVADISATVDELMQWSTERVLVAGPPPEPTVGNHPWAVPRPVVADMTRAMSELGYRPVVSYREGLAGALEWARSACAGRDWREVFTTMAAYPADPFDYDAEDRFLAPA